MTDKELRHLNRGELLQMLIIQGEENRRLKEQLEEANRKLEQRQLVMENAGSIAEASLQLSGIFEAAQQAAQQYLDSVTNGANPTFTVAPVSPSSFSVSGSPKKEVPSLEKTDDMTGDEFWQKVQQRAQLMLGESV